LSLADVPFNDLGRRIRAHRVALDDRIASVLDTGHFILGESGRILEEEFARYCGVSHGIGVANGTDALWLTLEAMGVAPGDEVITAGNTCPATIAAIVKAGATPVLVDVDPDTYTLRPELVEDNLTAKTRCVVPVHLYGQCADMEQLRSLCTERGVDVLEDCAQAHGAEFAGRRAGSWGHAAAFSFYPTKNLGAFGDGGMVVTNDEKLAERLRLIRNYGYFEPSHSIVGGYNSRLDEMQAVLLRWGLEKLDDWNARRRSLAATYSSSLIDTVVTLPHESELGHHVYHLYVVRSSARDDLRETLARAGVSTMIHYPVPVHLQKGFAPRCRVGAGGLSITERLSTEILSLPLFPELTGEEQQRVIAAVNSAADQ
jgi:dTDP-4-amino-4,6-dideoxygalactose transaminase